MWHRGGSPSDAVVWIVDARIDRYRATLSDTRTTPAWGDPFPPGRNRLLEISDGAPLSDEKKTPVRFERLSSCSICDDQADAFIELRSRVSRSVIYLLGG